MDEVILYLVRHGIAFDQQECGVATDAERPLSPDGQARGKAIAKGLRCMGVSPALIVSSPLQRAWQTAGIMAAVLTPGREVELCDSLQPQGSPAAVVRWLRERPETEIMAVGHMPDLAVLASYLLCGGIEVPLTFKKNGVCRISCTPAVGKGRGVLEWLMQPAQLRLMRGK